MVLEVLSENVSSTGLLAIVVTLVMIFIWNRRPSGLPPFPAVPLPVVGNLFSLEKDSRSLFAKWRKEYGDIFSLYMGSELVIVLNGLDCLKEALVKNADMFSDRPDQMIFTYIFRNKGIVATSGRLWKSQRKFALTTMRDFGFGRSSLEGNILDETENILKYFASKNGEKEHFNHIYNMSTSNILCSMVFGHRFEYDDPTFLDCCKAIDSIQAALPNAGLAGSLPILQYLPGDLSRTKHIMKCVAYLEEKLIKPELERHLKEYDGTTDDFTSAYIKEIQTRESEGQDATELRENFQQTVTDLFLGGTETTATALKWLVLFLLRFPDVQDKCYEEIKENVGVGRLPKLVDKALLPYVEATLAETQRLGNIVPLGLFHGVAEDTIFRGYRFPKGVTVIPNMDSVLMDPKVWPNPEKFRPERFLDEDGKFVKPEEFIPFSIGRRVCLGEALAKMELFLVGSALIQRFHFQQPEDEPTPSLEPVITVTSTPVPYKIKAVPRN